MHDVLLSSEVKQKWKWEAWHACKGLSREEAMLAFVKEVEKLDPSLKPAMAAAGAYHSPLYSQILQIFASLVAKLF
jgi:hypothetical protein